MTGSRAGSSQDQPLLEHRLRDSLQSLNAAEGKIVLAVSGGRDSVAMLRAMHAVRRGEGDLLTVAHANHKLRGAESDGDEQFVRQLCGELGIVPVCRDLPLAPQGGGVESTARDLRQEFFRDVARANDAALVATAHTADDQCETILHRIVRGTGLRGLRGIPRRRPLAPGIDLIRPLLDMRRSDLAEYLGTLRQPYRDDRSNLDLSYTRNRVRHELLPYLADHFNPQVVDAVVRLGQLAEQAMKVLSDQEARLAKRAVERETPDCVVLNLRVLRRAPAFLVRELLRGIWDRHGWAMQQLGHDQLDRVAAMVRGGFTAWDTPGGIRARVAKGKLLLERTQEAGSG